MEAEFSSDVLSILAQMSFIFSSVISPYFNVSSPEN